MEGCLVLSAQCSVPNLLCPLISNLGPNVQNAASLTYQTPNFYLHYGSECHQTISKGYSREVSAGL